MTTVRRCAIYTRKSSEEGLEQAFNSLHAQREACEAYIKSQKHEGWSCLRESYDDGGLSGATMQRPALQRLLADVGNGKIDVVVVYKVDRLTRALADFAKIVEVFDAKGVSFVSVTQQFNTTTSMGRLTLNVLLSFAQFEREVTGERIRDKIAASKKKGLWMGGLVPLGYALKDRSLLVNPAEAETVRTLFRLYQELGTVRRLKEAADRQKLVTRSCHSSFGRVTGGGPFTRGHLYCLLSNPIYVGEIRHKGATYPGQHDGIIDRKIFDAVQLQLAENGTARRSSRNAKAPSLLTGLVQDEVGDRLCPTHANKKGRRYRYYISKRLMHLTSRSVGGWRLPARELEHAVLQALQNFLCDRLRVLEALEANDSHVDHLQTLIGRASDLSSEFESQPPERQRQLLTALTHRITLHPDSLHLEIKRSALINLLAGHAAQTSEASDELFKLVVPLQLKRQGTEARLLVKSSNHLSVEPDTKLVTVLAEANQWINDLAHGHAASVRDLARRTNRDAGEVSRTLPLAFLSPDIVEAVLNGRQPAELTPRQLKRGVVPLRWDDQRSRLGFSRGAPPID